MPSLTRIKALIQKEFFQIIRDPSSILISIILPGILLFLYGLGVSLDAKNLKIGLVLEDSSPTVQSFAVSLIGSPFFDVDIGRDKREFEKDLIAGDKKGIVVIPSYFSSFLQRRPVSAPIQIITDGSEPNTARFVQNYVVGTFTNWKEIALPESDNARLKIEQRYWYNESIDSKYFLIPGSLAIIMTLIGTLLTALVIAREWERGTMESMLATPLQMRELLLSKLISYYLLGMGSFILSYLFSRVVFQVPFRGSFLILLGITSLFLFAALGLGLFISTVAKNQFAASQAALVSAFLPAFILSGFIFENSSMPLPIQLISYLIPAKYFVSSLQTLFLVGNVKLLLIKDMVVMLLFGLIFYSLTLHISKKRLS
jgi:ABC-2 type transport system permease protein